MINPFKYPITKFATINLFLSLVLMACNENPDREAVDIRIEDQELNTVPESLQLEAEPFMIDIEQATTSNENYREVSWTGEHIQLVLMSLEPGGEIDLEKHDDLDQFIRVEQGQAKVRMGENRDDLSFEKDIEDDWAVLIPAGYYHHLQNTGNTPLKIYTLYTPGAHPEGTVHKTYEEARDFEEREEH